MILVDQQRHDIRTAGRTALTKTHIDTHTGQHTAHDDQQQRFQITEQTDRIGWDNAQFRQPRLHAGQRFLEKVQRRRKHDDTENRFDTEIPTDDETCEQQQNTIDDERHRTDVDLEVEQVFDRPAQHQRRTRGTAAGTVCGQNTGDPRERVEENTDRHHEIFPYYAHNRPESYFFLQQSHFSLNN